MATAQTTYGTPTALTITLASLTSSATAGQQSTAVDNSTDRFLDVGVQVKVKLQTGTPANDKGVYVYAYGSVKTTSPDYTDGVAGTDGAFTPTDPPNLKLLGFISAPAAGGNTYKGGPWSLAQAFNGFMPQKWGIVVRNYTGVTLSATGSDHEAAYVGVKGDVT